MGGAKAAAEGGAAKDKGAKPERMSWTKAEDVNIVNGVHELGHKWYQIAQRLPGRTDHAIRNRYHRLQAMMHDQHLQAQQNQNQMMVQLPPLAEQRHSKQRIIEPIYVHGTTTLGGRK